MKAYTPVCFVSAVLITTSAWAQYVTGFETPTYVSGALGGQDSWTSTSATIMTAADLSAALSSVGLTPGTTVHGGSQGLFASGTGSGASVRPVSGLSGENDVVLDVWARPLTPGTSGAALGNIFMTMEDSAGNRAAAFRFGYDTATTTAHIDYGSSISGVWQTTGLAWNSDSWYRLTMSVDYAAKTYDFDVNGVRVNTSPIAFYNATSANFAQIRIFRGSNQAGMIVDDLTVVPEPSTLACLLLGGGLFLIRRARVQR